MYFVTGSLENQKLTGPKVRDLSRHHMILLSDLDLTDIQMPDPVRFSPTTERAYWAPGTHTLNGRKSGNRMRKKLGNLVHDLGEKQDASRPDGQSQAKDRMFSCGPLDPG